MAEVGRQDWQTTLGILSGLVPVYKCVRCKYVPHVVQTRPVTVGCTAQADLPRQRRESSMNLSAVQPVSPARNEQVRRYRSPRPMTLASCDIVCEHLAARHAMERVSTCLASRRGSSISPLSDQRPVARDCALHPDACLIRSVIRTGNDRSTAAGHSVRSSMAFAALPVAGYGSRQPSIGTVEPASVETVISPAPVSRCGDRWHYDGAQTGVHSSDVGPIVRAGHLRIAEPRREPTPG